MISQDFDTDPVNYTGSPFAVKVSDGTRHYALSNTPDIILNPGITGNASVYLAAQNMNNDGDGTLTYDAGLPAIMNFDVDATGFSDLKLSINLAGMPSAETENYIRALVDVDGDTFYETLVFDFRGINNTAYTDALLGPLSGEFLNFANISLRPPRIPEAFSTSVWKCSTIPTP